MALHHEILREILAGTIPVRFRVADLKKRPCEEAGRYRVGQGEYAERTLSTVPRNHSISLDGEWKGDYVQKGRSPAFFRLDPGEYQLKLDSDECDAEFFEESLSLDPVRAARESDSASSLAYAANVELARRIAGDHPDPAAIVVRYIAEQPLQPYFRRRPHGTQVYGWGSRLRAYFWPGPVHTWHTNVTALEEISKKLRSALRRLESDPSDAGAAGGLLAAFKEICLWGGVKLPEKEPGRLAAEVLSAVEHLQDGTKPPSKCRLNSAWTKLYAFALPEQCVIYDSRVASALTSILDPVIGRLRSTDAWQPFSALGTILHGRGGTRPRGLSQRWPNGYAEWTAQLAANSLCRKITDELNRQSTHRHDCRKIGDDGPWTLREVEAVLFMEGY